ncbi:hypothetical protein MYX04_13270 [Nitrospiraceae bacterium AH_259_D15_M11_P09]|nr:hypothetical protein [Nitrospiraceae bacterium AH_259_D15_M11_P09]
MRTPKAHHDSVPPKLWERPFHEARDLLARKTQADNRRHARMRAVFLEQLLQDKETVRLDRVYRKWALQTGLFPLVQAVARAGNTCAQLIGLADRSQLFAKPNEVKAQIIASNKSVTAEQLNRVFADIERGARQLTARIEKSANKILRKATTFVRQGLRLDWPWLAVEVADLFFATLKSDAFGIELEALIHVQDYETPAPSVTLDSRPVPGETVLQARTRVQQEYERAMQTLNRAAPPLPLGRSPRKNPERDADWVRWFYRHRIQGISTYQLAKEAGTSRQAVKYGLHQAECLLSLLAVSFK